MNVKFSVAQLKLVRLALYYAENWESSVVDSMNGWAAPGDYPQPCKEFLPEIRKSKRLMKRFKTLRAKLQNPGRK
jgi:hypothetical protein